MSSAKPIGRVNVSELTLTVKTIAVDGKRMTPPFYKQITSEGIIDEETGDMRGMPLGWFHLHQKDCPEAKHLHVLWAKDEAVRLATVVAPQDTKEYNEREEQSQARREHIITLLAYVLAQDNRYEASTYVRSEKRKISLGGYTLYVSDDAGELLDALEKARLQYQQECDHWFLQRKEALQEALSAAHSLQETFKNGKVRLAHPSQEEIIRRNTRIYAMYRADDRQGTETLRPKKNGWFVYTDQEAAVPEGENKQLLWHVNETFSEEKAQEVEEQLRGQVAILRVLLAQQAIEQDLQDIREEVHDLTQRVLEKGAEKSTKRTTNTTRPPDAPPTPKAIFALYTQEKKQFDEYTKRWNDSLAELYALEQLFLVS